VKRLSCDRRTAVTTAIVNACRLTPCASPNVKRAKQLLVSGRCCRGHSRSVASILTFKRNITTSLKAVVAVVVARATWLHESWPPRPKNRTTSGVAAGPGERRVHKGIHGNRGHRHGRHVDHPGGFSAALLDPCSRCCEPDTSLLRL